VWNARAEPEDRRASPPAAPPSLHKCVGVVEAEVGAAGDRGRLLAVARDRGGPLLASVSGGESSATSRMPASDSGGLVWILRFAQTMPRRTWIITVQRR
jgi:hypothetical protein